MRSARIAHADDWAAISGFRLTTGIVAIDASGKITRCNQSAADLFVGDAWQGRALADVFSDAEKFGLAAAGAARALAAALQKGEDSFQFETRGGRIILASVSAESQHEHLVEFTDVSAVLASALSRHRDPLTGLPNRLELLARLNDAMEAQNTVQAGRALLYIGLDRFKSVNDTLGHPVGDDLLKLVAERMRKLLGPGDVLARLGGDEFAILQAPGEQPLSAETLSRRLVDMLGRAYLVKGHMINIGASVGIALLSSDGDTAEELVKNADLALFKAKDDGRGTFRFFTEDMDRLMRMRRHLEVEMRRALALEEFLLAFQPQFDVAREQLVGFESLVRWHHPTRGTVSPGEFIPLAEEIGLIIPLGEWVLRTACRAAAAWALPLPVAVNLSPLQFRSGRLVEAVKDALHGAALSPTRLELEITEGALLDNTDSVLATLAELKALGVRVSMDDFGTGYSSLSYLQKFPFDKIKIDQSFVRNVVSNQNSAAIVRAVAALGTSLGMTTIAEGVETEEQLAQIARDGCQQVQGYLTGRPLAEEAASQLVNSFSAKHLEQE